MDAICNRNSILFPVGTFCINSLVHIADLAQLITSSTGSSYRTRYRMFAFSRFMLRSSVHSICTCVWNTNCLSFTESLRALMHYLTSARAVTRSSGLPYIWFAKPCSISTKKFGSCSNFTSCCYISFRCSSVDASRDCLSTFISKVGKMQLKHT